MKKLLLFLLLSVPTFMSAQVTNYTAVFPFDSVKNTSGRVDPTPLPVVTGLTFDSARAVGAVSANSSASFRFSFTNWPSGATTGNGTYAGLTGAVDPAKYYEFEIVPDLGVISAYTIDSIAFRFQRSGTGVRTYVVRGSEDAFAANLTAGVVPANPKISIETDNVFYFNVDSSSGQNGSKIYPGSAYSNLVAPVTFRFYGYNAEGNAGTFSIDNVTFYGTTTLLTSVSNYSDKRLRLYPNPAAEGSITLSSFDGAKNIEIYDLAGNMVNSVFGNAAIMNIPVGSLSAGTYLVKVITATGTSAIKFTKN